MQFPFQTKQILRQKCNWFAELQVWIVPWQQCWEKFCSMSSKMDFRSFSYSPKIKASLFPSFVKSLGAQVAWEISILNLPKTEFYSIWRSPSSILDSSLKFPFFFSIIIFQINSFYFRKNENWYRIIFLQVFSWNNDCTYSYKFENIIYRKRANLIYILPISWWLILTFSSRFTNSKLSQQQ